MNHKVSEEDNAWNSGNSAWGQT